MPSLSAVIRAAISAQVHHRFIKKKKRPRISESLAAGAALSPREEALELERYGVTEFTLPRMAARWGYRELLRI